MREKTALEMGRRRGAPEHHGDVPGIVREPRRPRLAIHANLCGRVAIATPSGDARCGRPHRFQKIKPGIDDDRLSHRRSVSAGGCKDLPRHIQLEPDPIGLLLLGSRRLGRRRLSRGFRHGFPGGKRYLALGVRFRPGGRGHQTGHHQPAPRPPRHPLAVSPRHAPASDGASTSPPFFGTIGRDPRPAGRRHDASTAPYPGSPPPSRRIRPGNPGVARHKVPDYQSLSGQQARWARIFPSPTPAASPWLAKSCGRRQAGPDGRGK